MIAGQETRVWTWLVQPWVFTSGTCADAPCRGTLFLLSSVRCTVGKPCTSGNSIATFPSHGMRNQRPANGLIAC